MSRIHVHESGVTGVVLLLQASCGVLLTDLVHPFGGYFSQNLGNLPDWGSSALFLQSAALIQN